MERAMSWLAFFSSSIGKKALVAITGLFMVVFVLAHLVGNLQIFSGPDALNAYGALLRSYPLTLWTLRIAMIAAVIVHLVVTISLATHNRQARPERYLQKKSIRATITSRTMILTGLTVLAFVLYHLAHYTLGIINPDFMYLVDSQGRHNVYNMVIAGFQNPAVVGFYVLAQILLACHLSHGFSSAARTLGVIDQELFLKLQKGGRYFFAVVALLYSSIPLAVALNFLSLDV